MQHHRSLVAWQNAHEVVLAVFDPAFRARHPSHFSLFDQLRRAALSVQLNVAEGYALGSVPSFRRHLRIAYGSAVETTDLLDLVVELQLLPSPAVGPVLERSRRSQGLVLGLLKSPNLRC